MTRPPATDTLESRDQDHLRQLRLALSAADFGDWSWDPQSDVVTLSERAAEMFGVEPTAEVTWTELHDRLHEEDRQRARFMVERAIGSGDNYEIEYRVATRAGEQRWIAAKGRAVSNKNGVVAKMVGVVYDVTRRKALEEQQHRLAIELQHRVMEWQSLFDTAPIAIWLAHDAECKVVTGNHYTNAILGVPQGTNISLTADSKEKVSFEILENGEPITQDQVPLRIACFKGVPVRNCEQEVRTPDGRSVSVLVSAVPLYNEKGEIRGALATALDITERKKNESALRESEERFRLMADASPALIWMAGPDKLCTWVNKAWLVFVGNSLSSQLGDGWTENIHPDDLKRCLQTYLGAFESRSGFELEYRLRRFDGEYRWLLTKGRPLFGPPREFTGFIGSCVDVTENKLRREELESLVAERTAQMKESISQLETFSYTVSHDMRAPLRSMEGFSQALLEDCGDSVGPTGRDYLKRIINSAQKLDLLIDHVLAYSKVATGRVHLGELHLGQVIAETIAQHAQLSPGNATITLDLQAPIVRANQAMLGQIFSNVLLNAVKFVAPGTRPVIHIRSQAEEGVVRVSVEDNGIGIAREHQERIFDIFSKLHADYEHEGTGIGLAIVKKAVQMLGGDVGLDSQCGQGTRFWFTLKG